MSYPHLANEFAYALKIEGTRGTFNSPTMADDALRLINRPRISWGYALPGTREGVATGGFGMPPSGTPKGRFGRVEIDLEITGSGDVGDGANPPVQPRWMRILETFMPITIPSTGPDDVTAGDPSTAQEETLSQLVQDGNKQWQLRGCVPERLVITGPEGENKLRGTATIAGIGDVDPTEQAPESQTFGNQTAQPTEFRGACSVGGTGLIYRTFEFDFGLSGMGFRVDRSQTDALLHGIITDVNPIFRVPAEVVALSTHNPFTRQEDPQTALAFAMTLGEAAGNKFAFSADHAEYSPENITIEDNDALMFWGLELAIRKPASGTWLSIAQSGT